MTERRDLEASLAEMDSKLRELQRELAGLATVRDAGAASAAPPSAAPPRDDGRIAELGRRVDRLAALCSEVQDATRSLRDELGGGAATPSPQ